MNSIKKSIPSALTCMNLALGFTAILLNHPVLSPILIIAGALFDVTDGIAARALKATSEFGKEIDSLADLITFGVAPAFLYFNIMTHTIWSVIFLAALPVGAAIRLARFNLSTDQTVVFKGLPSPANGLFFCTFPLLIQKDIITFEYNSFTLGILYAFPLLFAILMNMGVPLFSLKSIKYGLKKNMAFATFILLALAMVIGIQILSKESVLINLLASMPFIILL